MSNKTGTMVPDAHALPAHDAHAQALCRFIDEAPSPFHVVAGAVDLLEGAGFSPATSTTGGTGKFYRVHDGSITAWVVPEGASKDAAFRIVGAHTDSPNLHLKPEPTTEPFGYRSLGVETYGGVLLNSWLDRDLSLSGRVAVRNGNDLSTVLVNVERPILRIPQLAIHLDRDISTKGLLLNKQRHMAPIYGLARDASDDIWDIVANAAQIARADIIGADLMLHDTAPSQLIGADLEFISAPRLDNQLSCHAALTALSGVSAGDSIPVVTLFDHEEVGSVSATGAATTVLPRLLRNISDGLGASPAEHDDALGRSLFISADNAHATHPNYPDRHEPQHHIALNAGPALKHNANQRYTTTATSEGIFHLAAERAGVRTQSFVSRSDLPCGSTIGPTVSALLGMSALDVGCPQLAMHSCRELAGTNDPWELTLLLAELLSS